MKIKTKTVLWEVRVRVLLVAVCALVLSCGEQTNATPPPTAAGDAPTAVEVAEPTPTVEAVTEAPAPVETTEQERAASLYTECLDRVEGTDRAGECVADSDCKAAGCSGEVCVNAVDACGIMTTCEVLPCFQVLESCGCVFPSSSDAGAPKEGGVCQWTLGTRGGRPAIPVPGGVPTTD